MSGKLIVFEGTDGSGKATQTALLCRELESRGVPFRKLEFPRYKEESSALLRLYLSGAFGTDPGGRQCLCRRHVFLRGPLRLLQAGLGRLVPAGGLVIADRYTTSNAVHQTSKLPPQERQAFLDWLFDFEYRKLGLPEPDRVLYLDVPTELSEQMMRRREQLTHTAADIHERDEAYLRSCRESAAMVVDYGGWSRIDCARDGQVRSVDDIHREVMERLRDLLEGIK